MTVLLAACADGGYRTQPLPLEPERSGVVEEVRVVPLGDRGSGIAGAVIGGGVGGVAGSTVGSGRGSQAASVAGTVAGAIAGNVLANNAARREGLELTIRLDNGRQILVLQPEGEIFKSGERVRIIADKQGTRVTH